MRFLNGNVHTLDTNRPRASAIACDGGRIAAVGEPRDLPARGDEVDLRGRTVLPGMIDAHFHLRSLAEARQNVDLNGAVSAEEAARRVAARAAERGEGGWITGRGWD